MLTLQVTHAEDYTIHVQQFGLEEGLAHRNIHQVFKDSNGYLWITTNYSLQRYDGYEFKSYPLIIENGSLENFREIGETNDGWLWIYCFESKKQQWIILFLHPLTGKILTSQQKLGEKRTTLLNSLLDLQKYHFLSEHNDNLIYFTNREEVILFDFGQEEIQQLELPSFLPSAEYVTSFSLKLKDSKGNYWFQDDISKFILKYDPSKNIMETIRDIPVVQKIYERQGDVYLLDVIGKGQENFPAGLSKINQLGKPEEFLFKIPKGLKALEFLDDRIWCMAPSGWKVFDISGKLVFEFKKDDYGSELFGNLDYKNIISDEDGKIYLNSRFGFNIIEVKNNPFTRYFSNTENDSLPINNSARAIHVQNDSVIANFEFGGLVYMDQKNPEKYKVITTQSTINGSKSEYSAVTLLRDKAGNYWVNHRVSFLQSKWSPDFSKQEKINYTVLDLNQWENSWALWEDDIACIWSAYDFGIRRTCKGDSIQKTFPFKDIGIPYNEMTIYFFLKEENDLVWLCAANGLFLFDKRNIKILHRYHTQGVGKFNMPADEIFHMHVDQDGNRWLGTRKGLIFWNVKTDEKRLFNRDDGLSNEVIYAVYEDDHNKLWMSSDFGIMSLDKVTFDVHTYLPKDGISQEEFNRISHFKATDGRIYFGGLNGITAFHPDDFLSQEKRDAQILLSECFIFNGSDQSEVDGLKQVLEKQTITFRPNDRYFKLKFTLPTFSNNHKTRYAWKIEGVFNEWTYQKENSLQFGALPYGKHQLVVKGQTDSGGWSPHELKINIRVLKPFYLQNWFILLSILGILEGIFLFFKSRTRRLQKTKDLLEKEVIRATAQIQEQAEELKQLDKVKSRFFANVSHELRTPLTLILGPIVSAMKSGDLDERNFNLMKKARRSGRELLKLVGSILDLSKMDSGKIELYEQPEFFFPLIDRIVFSFESYAQSKGIQFSMAYKASKDLQLQLDKNKLEVILNNLLSNAVKFTQADGLIHTTIQDRKNTILISVADTGRGIHVKDQTHVFDRFYQSQMPDAPTEGGTGIGLALTNEFVKMMSGKIWLESELGKGTTFFVEIPKKETSILRKSEEKSDYVYSERTKLSDNSTTLAPVIDENRSTIIVTEDNYSLRDYIVTILSPYYNVFQAENGRMALNILQTKKCDLIMSDIMMPEMDGFQLLKELKSNDYYRNLPVIMLTARAEIKDKLKALRIGVDDYLLKPFEEEELLARIENLLQNYNERKIAHAEIQTKENSIKKPLISQEDAVWLEQLEAHLNQFIPDSGYSVVKLAYDMAISERQLRRRVKLLTGLTPIQYFKEIRLNKARQLLQERKHNTIAQTAYAVGFQNAKSFSRSFYQRYGKTPATYITG